VNLSFDIIFVHGIITMKLPSNEDFTQKFNQLEDWEQTLILSSIQKISSMMKTEKLTKKDIQKKLEKIESR
ncbi:MAG: hypothetical protein L6305_00505, partial [Actinomycetia bacterium]|nr:hypothetical protein [Actinomycetes bacterium]